MRFVDSGSNLNLSALVKCHIRRAGRSTFKIRKSLLDKDVFLKEK